MTIFGLQILTSKPQPTLPFTGREFINALNDQLQKSGGGSCHGMATVSGITAEVSCTSRGAAMELVDSFVVSLLKRDAGMKVVVNDVVPQPLSPEQKTLAASYNIAPAKLTLRFLLSLPDGYVIASNCWAGPQKPAFADFVAPADSRKDQWKQIVAAGAAQRTCHVFRSNHEYNSWINGMVEFFASQKGAL